MWRSSPSRLLPVLFLFLATALLQGAQNTDAAEWSKLKTCANLGFCRRHRQFQAATNAVYVLDKSTLKKTLWRGSHAVTASLIPKDVSRTHLLIAVVALGSGVFRVAVDDLSTPLHERYISRDVIMDHVQPLPLDKASLRVDETFAELTLDGWNSNVRMHFDPFRVDLVSDDDVLISINSESRLLVDSFAPKPSPSPSPSPDPSPQPPSPSPSTADGEDDEEQENADHEDYYHYEEDDDEHIAQTPSQEASSMDSACDGCWEERFQSHTDPKLRGPESVGTDIHFPFAEHIYGIPERTVDFSLGNTIDAEGNVVTEPYRLYNLDVFEFELVRPLGLYGSVPFLMARKGTRAAAMLWLNAAETYVDVSPGVEGKGPRTHWYSETGIIDTYLLSGPTPSHIYKEYLWLTGPPAIPQRFALGYHQCRWNYRNDEDARTVDATFDERDIPYDVLWLDIEHTNGKRYFTWDLERFPDPTALQNHIAARGRKMVTIIDPHIKRDNKYALHRYATEQKYYVMKPDGKPFEGWCWPGSSSYFDFTSPTVREAWASRFNPTDYPHFTEHLYTWNDMNEPSVFNGPEGTMQKDMIHDGGVEHRHVHNIYGHYFMQATFEGLLKGHGGNDRPFVLSRSFFAGSQKFGAIWTGDNTAAWDHLESTVRMLLPLQISGMIFAGADVGGFFGNPSAELLTRWYQVGAFQPFFRGHAHIDTNRREPWLFGEPYTTHISTAIRTRYEYIPFWYTLFAGNALGEKIAFDESYSGPPMRPLWWEFPNDKHSDTDQKQWTVGNALLVAPILSEGATTHTIHVPDGEKWYDLFDPIAPGKLLSQDGMVEFSSPLERMIVLQRGGTIIPKQERRRRSTVAMARDPFTLVVALDADRKAEGELYLDDGRSFDHTLGKYMLQRFAFKDGVLSVETVSGGDQEFVGSDATIERVVILGYGTSPPSKVIVGDNEISYVHSEGNGVLTIQKPEVCVGKEGWEVEIV